MLYVSWGLARGERFIGTCWSVSLYRGHSQGAHIRPTSCPSLLVHSSTQLLQQRRSIDERSQRNGNQLRWQMGVVRSSKQHMRKAQMLQETTSGWDRQVSWGRLQRAMLERAQSEGATKGVVAQPLYQERDVGASDTDAAHARLKYGIRHGHVIDSPSSCATNFAACVLRGRTCTLHCCSLLAPNAMQQLPCELLVF